MLASLLLTGSLLASPVAFPLKPGATGRYLVDRNNQPFLYQADTAWMLLLRLNPDEASEYFSTRKSQGFTAIQVMLTGFLNMTNRAGVLPFLDNHDFSKPNEAFFRPIDEMIARAGTMNLVLAIAPLWAGCCGEGWAGRSDNGGLKPMNTNGPDKCRQFGRWLGKRYGKHPHLLWILGGDNDPNESREEMRALALGLKEAAPQHLLTYHPASSHTSTEVWPGEPWIDFPMVYTYFRGFNKAWNKNQPDVYEIATAEYQRRPARPFFLGESTYEGEHDAWGSPLQARKQAYWAILAGAAGHAYGSPNWRCEAGWREGLLRPGALSLRHWHDLFATRPWWRLVPDPKNQFVTAGHGPFATNDCAVAALADDGTFGMAYLPSPRRLTVNLNKLSGTQVRSSWYDVRTGNFMLPEVLQKTSAHEFAPPPPGDWVLLLENHSPKKP
jgi:hypothetical protein